MGNVWNKCDDNSESMWYFERIKLFYSVIVQFSAFEKIDLWNTVKLLTNLRTEHS